MAPMHFQSGISCCPREALHTGPLPWPAPSVQRRESPYDSQTACPGTGFFIFQTRLVHFHIFRRFVTEMLPHLVGAMGPSPPHNIVPSIIRPFSWADMGSTAAYMAYHICHSAYGFFITFYCADVVSFRFGSMEVDDAFYAPDTVIRARSEVHPHPAGLPPLLFAP